MLNASVPQKSIRSLSSHPSFRLRPGVEEYDLAKVPNLMVMLSTRLRCIIERDEGWGEASGKCSGVEASFLGIKHRRQATASAAGITRSIKIRSALTLHLQLDSCERKLPLSASSSLNNPKHHPRLRLFALSALPWLKTNHPPPPSNKQSK